jgi:hypothetical protein
MVFFLCSAVRLRSVALHEKAEPPALLRGSNLQRAPPEAGWFGRRGREGNRPETNGLKRKDLKTRIQSLIHFRKAGETGVGAALGNFAAGMPGEYHWACLRRFSGEERNGSGAISARLEIGGDCGALVKWNAAEPPESGDYPGDSLCAGLGWPWRSRRTGTSIVTAATCPDQLAQSVTGFVTGRAGRGASDF